MTHYNNHKRRYSVHNNDSPSKRHRSEHQQPSQSPLRDKFFDNDSSHNLFITETDEFGRQLRPFRSSPTPPIESSPPSSSMPIRHPTPPVVQSPTQEYLAAACLASETTTSDSPINQLPRKLVIFDLNGTLLRRSPRPGERHTRRHSNQPPGPRNVYPRPYLSSLIAYMFHPTSKTWLDVMVWSSAQPYNVRDMVEKCFGKDEFLDESNLRHSGSSGQAKRQTSPNPPAKNPRTRRLKTVWARDTLGLSEAAYHNKVVTIKDLSKPWAAFNAGSLEPLNETHSKLSSKSRSGSVPPTPQIYSALSTLLVDDSPEKCVLQPYNHLCVPEYDSQRMHASGLAKWKAEVFDSRRTISSEIPDNAEEGLSKSDQLLNEGSQVDSPIAPEGNALDAASTKDKHRGEKQKGAKKTKSAMKRANREKVALELPEDDSTQMDQVMLALVGIFDTIKYETNVAAWVKDGGLWAGFKPVVTSITDETKNDSKVKPAGNDAGTISEEWRTDSRHSQNMLPERSSAPVTSPPPSSPRSLSNLLASHRKYKSPSPAVEGKYRPPALRSSSQNASINSQNASINSQNASINSQNASINPIASTELHQTEPLPTWFDSVETVEYWANKGREALERLGIPIKDGVKATPP